jgi:hypothetical protein
MTIASFQGHQCHFWPKCHAMRLCPDVHIHASAGAISWVTFDLGAQC